MVWCEVPMDVRAGLTRGSMDGVRERPMDDALMK